MQSAFIINDRTGKPYAVVGILAGGTEFYPIAESAVSWASWMVEEFAAKKITKQQLTVTLDNSMSVEGPMPANRANKAKLDELIKKAKKIPKGESDKTELEQTEEKTLVPVISVMDARIDNLEDRDWRNAVNFKAKSFLTDSNKSTFAYEVKRTRAVWDPSLSIPGTERRGGFRCPPGTRFGGQITDRFGRNCGWGVARRLANEIADLGERVEGADDKRRARRVGRRNERVARRMAEGGRVERAARAIGNAMETRPDEERKPGRLERGAGRIAEALDTPTGRERKPGVLERAAGRVAEALDGDTETKPRRGRRGQNRRRDEGFMERLERGVRRLEEIAGEEEKPKPRRPRPEAPEARPARPRQPRRQQQDKFNLFPNLDDDQLIEEWHRNAPYIPPQGRIGMNVVDEDKKRKRRQVIELEMGRRGIRIPKERRDGEAAAAPPRRADNVSGTPVPAGAPIANETLEEYKRRKYNEHQARVREIRERGGRAGFLRYEEWERFHGPIVEENWNRAQERNRGRGARRRAADAGAARSATRRPSAADAPERVQPQRRQRIPFKRYRNQRALNSESAAWRKVDALNADENNLEMRDLGVVEFDGKFYIVNGPEMENAVDAGARRVERPDARRPAAPPRVPAAPARPQSEPAAPPAVPITPSTENKERKKRKPLGLFFRGKKNDAKIGAIGSDGLPAVRRVEIGNKGMNTKADAVRHLANGGDIADVPDDFVIDAMNSNSGAGKRYTKAIIPGRGVNGPLTVYTDASTGKRYITKYTGSRYKYNEDINEILGNNIAGRIGMPIGEFRFAGPEFSDRHGKGRPIMFEHVENYIDGVAVQPTGSVPFEDAIGATLLDYLILNTDRHGGNYFVVVQDGKKRFVPIDPSLGFNARSFRGAMADRAGFRDWLQSFEGGGRNNMISRLKRDVQEGRVSREQAVQVVQRLQDQLREAEAAKPYLEFAEEAGRAAGADGRPRDNISPQTTAAAARISFILGQSASDIVDEILR